MKDAIRSYIPAECPWRDTLYWFNTIDSTNTRAKELAAAGAPHGTVVIAGHQSAGRGRMGRSFHSPAGLGLYLSVILRPQCAPEELMHLTCACGVAACDAVEAVAGMRPGIKWINDLTFGVKKAGGILTELSLGETGVAYAVVGIGLNCNHHLTDFPEELRHMVTSLKEVTGKEILIPPLAGNLIASLWDMDKKLFAEKRAIMDTYRRDCITLGKDISILQGDRVTYAKALDIDDNGGLMVRTDDGQSMTVQSGEASVRGMYGYIR